jgi:hypothetical protein
MQDFAANNIGIRERQEEPLSSPFFKRIDFIYTPPLFLPFRLLVLYGCFDMSSYMFWKWTIFGLPSILLKHFCDLGVIITKVQ